MEFASLLEFRQMTAASGDFNSQTIFTQKICYFSSKLLQLDPCKFEAHDSNSSQ